MIAHRILIIGLDGIGEASFTKARRMGLMPFWDGLRTDSLYGTLHSVMPYITPVAWSSFHTGCEPVKHGVLDWRVYDRFNRTDAIGVRAMIRKPTIWQWASQHGRRVACLGVPMCYPPDEVNGVMVSGFDTPLETDDFAYPKPLAAELRKSIADFSLLPKTNYGSRRRADLARTVEQAKDSLRVRADLFEHVVRRETFDLAMIQFQSTDWVQHRAWMYIDPHPLFPIDPQREALTLGFFAALDETLRRVLTVAEDRFDTICILSDHGFGRGLGTVYPNVLLKEMGLLTAHDEDIPPAEASRTHEPWFCKVPLVGSKLDTLRRVR
ncbi:MAG: alkaline phosphatase family protein, partial [Planctomycetes bacterium]|nr:alkaline phosphatase family protein [Planctomycetota bacterium]